MKPIHKLNNGRGVTLCNKCSVIISEGLTEELFCDKCKQKQALIDMMQDDEKLGLYDYGWCKGNVVFPKEEPKQETIEQAAENYGWRIKKNTFSDAVKANELAESAKQDFIAGAKWQAKRMYSEEEVRAFAYNAFCLGQLDNPTENKFNGWFKQFRKK